MIRGSGLFDSLIECRCVLFKGCLEVLKGFSRIFGDFCRVLEVGDCWYREYRVKIFEQCGFRVAWFSLEEVCVCWPSSTPEVI